MKIELMRGPDEGGAGGNVPIDLAQSVFEEPKVEVVEDEGGVTKDLETLYKEQQRKIEALEKRPDPTDVITKSFERLGTQLDGLNARVASPQPVAGESFEEFQKRVDREIIERPSAVLREFQDRYAGPVQEQLLRNQMKLARKVVAHDLEGEERETFREYAAEIDQVLDAIPVASRLNDPAGAIESAFAFVKSRHVDEIVAKRVAKGAPGANGGKGATTTASGPRAPVGTLEGSSRTPPVTASKAIRVTAAQAERVRAAMRANNVPEEKFGTIVEYYREQGLI